MSAVSRAEIVPDQYTVAYASAIAGGRLEIIVDPEERMHAMAVLCRQYDPAAGEKYVGCMRVWAQEPAWCAWLWRRSPEKRAWAKIKKNCFPSRESNFFSLSVLKNSPLVILSQ